jgi:hypothetical protein
VLGSGGFGWIYLKYMSSLVDKRLEISNLDLINDMGNIIKWEEVLSIISRPSES